MIITNFINGITGGFFFSFSCFYVDSCDSELGMVNRDISDSQITASSFHSTLDPPSARLRTSADSWSAATNNPPNQWIQVNLQQQHLVSGVITQGRGNVDQWVTEFKVEYSGDGMVWTDVDNGMVCIRV